MGFDPTTIRRDDYGFFGPGSPSWKIWTAPTAVIGFQRAVVLEHFDPFLTASVADSQGIYNDPRKRLDHTFAYFLLVAVADGRTAIQASEHLMQIHAPMTGIEPITGQRYAANSPETQLWIHLTGWHSVLKAYEVYGPGKLSESEELRFWEECAIAAELQTCKPSDVPRTRDGVREYFEKVKPRLCSSVAAETGMHHLLRTSPRNGAGISYALGSRILSLATAPLTPMWMRKLGRYNIPRIVDPLVKIPAKLIVWASTWFNSLGLILAAPFIAPMAGQILKQHVSKDLPTKLETITPARARELYSLRGSRTPIAEAS